MTIRSEPGVGRDVGCELVFDVTRDSLLALQVAPATTAGAIIDERLEITSDGAPLMISAEVAADHGGRTHVVAAPAGRLSLAYSAALEAHHPTDPEGRGGETLTTNDAVVALRQSRYCPSDALVGFATTEFAASMGREPDGLALDIVSWTFERLAYAAGSSGPLDTAVSTLLSGSGVCRDFAHVAITLCRALGIPARLVSVYAPGLMPMDFHAVIEVLTSGGWQVLDPTRLAPRATLVRIATGRDAADTAFATTLRGDVQLVASRVFASSEGDLPTDDHAGPRRLA